MNILIIANSSIVFGRELQDELIGKNHDVCLLDFASLVISNTNHEKDERYSNKFLRYKDIPKLSMFFRVMIIRQILRENNFDIVNVHYSRWVYLPILKSLIRSKLVITFYGSDFYRTTDRIKNIQKIMYKKADAITFTNPLTKKSFLEYYDDFEEKSFVCRLGLKTLDFIDNNIDKSKIEVKEILGYSTSKIVVTCGYNATSAQQHKKIIQSIETLGIDSINKCQFIFPLTYGDSKCKIEIKNMLKNVSFDYIILEEFLYEDDNAYIKIASDIMINILETDSFSGSMQEFLYAQNIIITGSWLPYELFDSEGIAYYKIDNTDELKARLLYVIKNIKNIQLDLDANKEIIYKLSSWKNNINQWESIYKYSMKENYEN